MSDQSERVRQRQVIKSEHEWVSLESASYRIQILSSYQTHKPWETTDREPLCYCIMSKISLTCDSCH